MPRREAEASSFVNLLGNWNFGNEPDQVLFLFFSFFNSTLLHRIVPGFGRPSLQETTVKVWEARLLNSYVLYFEM